MDAGSLPPGAHADRGPPQQGRCRPRRDSHGAARFGAWQCSGRLTSRSRNGAPPRNSQPVFSLPHGPASAWSLKGALCGEASTWRTWRARSRSVNASWRVPRGRGRFGRAGRLHCRRSNRFCGYQNFSSFASSSAAGVVTFFVPGASIPEMR